MENQRKGGSAINRDVGLGPAPLFLFWGGVALLLLVAEVQKPPTIHLKCVSHPNNGPQKRTKL